MLTPRNHTKLLFTLLFITTLQISSYCQGDVLMVNGQTFEVEAYKDIEGTPYYFEKWQLGKVFDKKGKELDGEQYLLNFNGYSKSFEVRKDKRFIALDESYYSKVVVETEENGKKVSTTFKTHAHPIFKNRFMKVIFEGTDFTVIQDFQVRLSTREKTTYAAKENNEEFGPNSTYYFVKNGKAKSIKLKKKAVLSLLKDQQKALENFVKAHKLKVNKETDLVQLFAYYEQLNHPKNTVAANED